MTPFIQNVEKMESDIAGAGKTVAEFCRLAGIARSTWDRWKSGKTTPNMSTWDTVTEKLTGFLASSPEEDAA